MTAPMVPGDGSSAGEVAGGGDEKASGSKDAESARRSVRRLARLLDAEFRVPFTRIRFGFDAVLGIVPGVGDAAGLAAATVVIARAVRLGARGWTVARMVGLALVDAAVGTVPVLGTVADVAIKANTRNLALLERHLDDPAAARTSSRRSIVATIGVVAVVHVAVLVALVAGAWWLVDALLG